MVEKELSFSSFTLVDSKGATFVILKDHASVPARRERLSARNKARRKASRNGLEKESGMPDRVKSLGKVDNRKDRPRAWFGFV